MSLISLQGISKDFKNRTVLENVSLQVESKDRVGLIGDNGTGKSTLIRIAMGRLEQDTGQVITARGIKIGYLSQESDELMSGQQDALHYEKIDALEREVRRLEVAIAESASDISSEAYKQAQRKYQQVIASYEASDGYNVHHELQKILVGLGLDQHTLFLPLDKLSGGEKMRVALARMLLEKPDLLILDEPTNHLDVHAIEWLEDYLKKFKGGVLMVSHDRYFLDRVATRIAELDQGSLLEMKCSYSDFIEQKNQARAYHLQERRNLTVQIRDLEALIVGLKSQRKHIQVISRTKELDRLKTQLEKAKKQAWGQSHLRKAKVTQINVKGHGHVSKEVAWAEDLCKHFYDKVLFESLSFNIYGGEKVALIGANGCGKTTLLNILKGEDTQFRGTAKLGSWINYAFLGQNVSFDDENISMLEYLMVYYGDDEKATRKQLEKLGFYGDQVKTPLAVLSGGERVRVYFAMLMANHPHCLILDEPTNHLDLSSRQALEKAILAFRGTVIAVSHDRYYLNYCVDKVIEIKDKSTRVFKGNYDAYMAHTQSKSETKVVKKKSPCSAFKSQCSERPSK